MLTRWTLRGTRPRLWAGVVAGVLTVAAACGDSSGPGTPNVESITISGAPPSPLLSGTTVQLIATPINNSGGAISDARITWTSSDESIAKVSGQGVVTGVGAGPVTITAEAGGKQGTATLDARVAAAVGPNGATLAVPGRVSVTLGGISAGNPVTWMLRPAPASVPVDGVVPGTAWELAPATAGSFPGGSLTVTYDAGRLPAGMVETTLQMYRLELGGWVVVRNSAPNLGNRTVTVTLTRGGTYAVRATTTDRIVLGGAPLNGALYVGQSGTVTAALLSTGGDTLRNRPVAWTTSDPSKATVDNTGKVTAVAAGSATITATVEGKSATGTVVVLARPVAAWGQTEEWATFQGNGRHTGAINATLDPAAFRPLWNVPVGAGPLNPVTTGDGRVFVTTTAYFGEQKLAVLNAGTGSQVWSRDFGRIHSVHPPAYGNGRVYLTTGGHQDSFLWSFDAATGDIRFRTAYGNQWSRWHAPVVTASTVYMAGGYYSGMYAFNALDGTQRWFVNTNQYDEWTPAVADGKVYAYTGSYAPKLSVVDAASGAAAYEVADPAFEWGGWSMNQSPVLGGANNLLATQGGRLISFDLQSRRIGWQIRGSFTGNVTVADGTLYVFNNRQVEARRESDGALLWVWVAPEGEPRNTMIITNNFLLVSTAANTYAVDLAARRHTWSYAAGGHLAVSRDGVLFIAQANGSVTAINLR